MVAPSAIVVCAEVDGLAAIAAAVVDEFLAIGGSHIFFG